MAVVTPRGVRSYARDSVDPDLDLDVIGGLGARLVITRTNQRAIDTVFRSLSFRDVVRLALVLQQLQQEDSTGKQRRRVRARARSS